MVREVCRAGLGACGRSIAKTQGVTELASGELVEPVPFGQVKEQSGQAGETDIPVCYYLTTDRNVCFTKQIRCFLLFNTLHFRTHPTLTAVLFWREN